MKLSNESQGILWFLASRVSFAIAGIVIKSLPYSAIQFNFVRSSFVILFVIPFFYVANRKSMDWLAPFRSQNPGLMFIRVILGSFGLICFYYTFQTMSYAKAFTIAAATTFITPIFAKFFLGEIIGFYRILSIVIGYIGVWYALDPVYSGIDLPEFVALVNVIITASANTISKKLLIKDKPLILMFYAAIFSIFISTFAWSANDLMMDVTGAVLWPEFSFLGYIGLVLLLGPFAFLGQYGYLKAFRKADLSLLMPYDYTNFVFAALLGYLFFMEIPDHNTWVAMGLIITATTLLGVYEMSHKSPKKTSERK